MCGGDHNGLDWGRVAPRIIHPTKLAILTALGRTCRALSATTMKPVIADPEITVGQLHYHCTSLRKAGVIEIVANYPRGAANETFYRLTPTG